MFKVPKKTSVFTNDNRSPSGVISFAPELIKFIKQKKKYVTYRFADEKYRAIKPGDTVEIKKRGSSKIIGYAKVTSAGITSFADLPLQNPGHETPKNKEHQRQVLSGYYAFLSRPIKDDDEFLIIEFRLIS